MIARASGLGMLAAGMMAAAPSPAPTLLLAADGLGLPGGRRVRFEIPAAPAIAAVTAALGKPIRQGTYPDCGQGIPIRHVDYRGDLELSFIAGRFVGWTLAEKGDPRARTAQGIHLGSTFAELKRAYPDVTVDDTGESITFGSERGPSGFLDRKGARGKVIDLHAGQTCIVD